jgi:hypothetical protein
MKAPKSSEPEPPKIVPRKRPLEGMKDAKEVAKKLLSQGKIRAIKPPGNENYTTIQTP